ncbi:MAG: hypothetical protein HKN36_08940 [Hellea sp.]|nr:hypothetical protein [Hellea sp.]
MFKKIFLSLSLSAGLCVVSAPAIAQNNDVSPVLYFESGPSDNPEYRRMVHVKYLAGDQVRVAYKAYNRAEFIQVPNSTPSDILRQCANGEATSFRDIQSFERAEARRLRNGQAPEVKTFCVKNVSGWESQGNRTKYLDPIFNGMPHAAAMK